MRSGALDPVGLLTVLSRCGVDFVVIGAMAVGVHGEVRSTGDLDVMVPAGDEPNRRALAQALEQLRAVRLTAAEGGAEIARGDAYPTVVFSTSLGKLDVLDRPDGSDTYANVKRRALEATIGGHSVYVAGRDDLVRMKLAAGRPHDLHDVAALTAADEVHVGPRVVTASMVLGRGVDPQRAIELASARVALFDAYAKVAAADGSLTIEATRSDLTDAQIGLWARALADRLHGAGILAGRDSAVTIRAGD